MPKKPQTKEPIEVTGNTDKLDDFYATLQRGLSVRDFLYQYDEIMGFIRSHGFIEDYRLGRGRVKKLRDEVTPVARFASKHAGPADRIRFALDDTYPDCVICHQDGRQRDVEVTMAHARKRQSMMTELNETGTGRGFINVKEDASTLEFEDAMGREREAYSTDQVIDCVLHDIELRAQKKKWHRGDTLLIELDLKQLPSSRWEEFLARFTEKAKTLKFREVYLTGRGDNGDTCLKIK